MSPNHIALTALLALFTPALTTHGFAQEAQEKAHHADEFVLEAGNYKITELLERASKFLSRNYFWTAAEADNQANVVTIQQTLRLDPAGCEDVLSQLLNLKGFVIVPLDKEKGMYEAISERGQRISMVSIGAPFLTPDEVLRIASRRTYVMTSVPLKHIDAAKAAQQLRPFFTSGGGRQGIQFGSPGTEFRLMMIGYASQVATAIRLLRDADQPATDNRSTSKTVRELYSTTNHQESLIRTLQAQVTALHKQLATLRMTKIASQSNQTAPAQSKKTQTQKKKARAKRRNKRRRTM